MNRVELLQRTYDRYVVQKLPPGFDVDDRACMYKADNGARCAIGHELGNNKIMLACEGDVHDLFEAFPKQWKKIFGSLSVNSAFEIQRCHDNAAAKAVDLAEFREAIKVSLKTLAGKWKCKLTP